MAVRNVIDVGERTPVIALVAAALPLAAAAAGQPDVEASIKFPDSNPFGRVTNGNSNNLLHVRVSNHGAEAVTVTRVHGQFREPSGKERPLRNTTTMPLGLPVGPAGKSPLIPYKFHSENKIGDIGLRVWVDYIDANRKTHSVLGYDSTVTVGEPASSWFDLELIFLYLLLGGIFSGVGYLVYTSYFAPAASSSTKRRPSAVTAKSASIVDGTDGSVQKAAKGSTGVVDESWVPEHHLRARKAKAGGYTSATSGDESEGTPRRRSARK
ncbi:uncharacterized protein JCM10292_003832 [Rhodotorula paludigena]|uniref:uncharacterized protein n=1 Tax=Rhodotorula paludigena TaxID=86838 RepID=UPI00317FFAF7